MYPALRGFSFFFSNELELRSGDDELPGERRKLLGTGNGTVPRGRGALKGSLGGGVPPRPSNPDPV